MAIAILAILTAIVGAVLDTGKAVLDTISSFFQSIFTLFQSFVQSAPPPMRIAIFLFFILTFGNIFSNFILGTAYACDSNNVLYQTDDIVTAMQGILKIQFQNPTITDRNTFIHSNYQLVSQKPSPTNVKCASTQPKLFFYSINILDYNLWLLLLVVGFGVPMIWGYYSRMGVLGGH
jgi:hypothetical protein